MVTKLRYLRLEGIKPSTFWTLTQVLSLGLQWLKPLGYWGLAFSLFHWALYILFIFQRKIYKKSNTNLFCSYSIIFPLYKQFCLMIEHNKSKVFHFSRIMKNYKPSSLDLRPLGRHLLQSKYNWKYLKFIFDRILTFHQHIHFYANKVLSIIKNIKMLENSIRRLLLIYKWILYKICIIPITLYSFQP